MCSTQNPAIGSGSPSGGFAPSTAQASSSSTGRFSRCPQTTVGRSLPTTSSTRWRFSPADTMPTVNARSPWTSRPACAA